MSKQIVINQKRLGEVAKAAVGMLERRVPPFNQDNLFPDAIIPDGVPKEFFLFYGCSLDSMKQATEVYRTLRVLASKFDLTRLHEVTRRELVECLGTGLESAVGKPLETLMENAKQLADYGGNPINLKHESVDDTINRIASFHQFAEQKAALLMKNYVRFRIWDFPEHTIPIKVDRHAIRICLGAGVLADYSAAVIKNPASSESENLQETANSLIRRGFFTRHQYEAGEIEVLRGEPLINPLSRGFREYTTRTGMSAVKLDDALWAIGANTCFLNRETYCKLCCEIGCNNRPPSDNSATYFFPGIEKRKMARDFLFT